MYCKECGNEMPDGAVKCPNCGTVVDSKGETKRSKSGLFCNNCGAELSEEDYKCPKCGAETRRKKVKSKLAKTIGIFAVIICVVAVTGVGVYKSGIIQNYQVQKEGISWAKTALKNFEFDTVECKYGSGATDATLYFNEDGYMYMPLCKVNTRQRIGYVNEGAYYESYGEYTFSPVDDVVYTKDSFSNIIESIDTGDLTYVGESGTSREYKGVLKSNTAIVDNLLDLYLYDRETMGIEDKTDVEYILRVGNDWLSYTMEMDSGASTQYEILYTASNTDVKSGIESLLLDSATKEYYGYEGTYYNSDINSQIVIDDNYIQILNMKPVIMVSNDGKDDTYDAERVTYSAGDGEPYIEIEGVRYDSGTRQVYMDAKMLEDAEAERQREIANTQQLLYDSFTSLYPVGSSLKSSFYEEDPRYGDLIFHTISMGEDMPYKDDIKNMVYLEYTAELRTKKDGILDDIFGKVWFDTNSDGFKVELMRSSGSSSGTIGTLRVNRDGSSEEYR